MDKISLLRKKMSESGIDAVIITDELNQHYLTDFSFTDGFLLVSFDSAILVTDFRYYEMALERANKAFEVVMPKNRRETVNAFISDNSVKTMGFEGNSVSYAAYMGYVEAYPFVKFVTIGNMLSELRKIKSKEEIKKMQLSQDIADKAFSHVLGMLNPNMTEIDVAVEIEYAMRKFGAEGAAFDTVAVSGDASAIPHGTPRPLKLKKGFLTMDFGAKLDGYLSDMTRTVVIGKADADIKKLYNTVLMAQTAAIDFLKEGVDAGEADKIARDIIDSYPEYKGTFGHSLGHSIGLFVHEMPALSPKSFGIRLESGQVTSVEPGIYISGKYGCRIEDMVAIEKGGVYNFTHSAKDLIEIY